jgi:hypothetical protein
MAKTDQFKVSHFLNLLTPSEQQALPVPLDEWHRIMNRIKKCNEPTNRLEAFAWGAVTAGLSFLLVAVTLPFSVEWSKVVVIDSSSVERLNWPAMITEGVCGSLALLGFVTSGLAFYWANKKQKLLSELGESLINDMQAIEDRYSPQIHQPTLQKKPGEKTA